jgi:ribosomal protein S18 acetylase RimI-like enzyme
MQLETRLGLVTIRPAELADAENFRALRLQALRDHPDAFSADYAFNASQPIAYWEQRLSDPSNKGMIFFAESQPGLVGMCGVRRENSPATQHSATVWGVFVLEQWRGLHIAENLIQQCVGWASANEVSSLRLGVVTTNSSAVRCYRRCGFIVYGVEPQSISVNDRMYDEFLMVRYV